MALSNTPSPFPPPFFSILLLLLFFVLQPPLSFPADTISANSSISGDQQLTSKRENFVLGFYCPVNSTKYYIAIWYKKVPKRTAVWIANRETPVSDHTTSELKLSRDGNLVLLNESKAQIWSTNATIFSNSTVAVLEDSGSLVLRDGSNSSKVFWQSIDHPTHTWLPGGKLGLNNKFYQMDSMRLPENGQNLDVGSAEDCASACLNNCSCNAYSFNSGCQVWYGNLTNLQEQYNGSNEGTLYLRLAASELPDSTSKKGKVTRAVVGAVAGFVVCVVVAWVLIWRHRKRRMIRAADTVTCSISRRTSRKYCKEARRPAPGREAVPD